MTHSVAAQPLVNLSELAQIELFVLRRMQEFTLGEHASVYTGAGFNFSGLRDWEPGDSASSIEWAQSSLTNFNPIVVRQFEQDTNAGVVVAADASLSTRCGMDGNAIMLVVARALATIGLSAVLLHDRFGLIAFDGSLREVGAARQSVGKSHVIHCLDVYARMTGAADRGVGDLARTIEGYLRRATLVPVISDFMFANAPGLIDELASLNVAHDVLLVMIDAQFAFELPPLSSGWIEVRDVDSDESFVLSRAEYKGLAQRAAQWQNDIAQRAAEAGIDVVRVGLDQWQMTHELVQFIAQRRVRKVRM
jgi:uncharacterized protein (DUF58 family)